MKWRGRPQSDMVRDLRGKKELKIEDIINSYKGGVVPGAPKSKDKDVESLPDSPPLPTPRPKKKKSKLTTQVTPGKWETK